MKAYARPLLLSLAAIALAASVASLYVHYRLVSEPDYSSFCDISQTVSCQQVFQSEYGSAFGVPVAAGGAIWSALVLLLAWGMKGPNRDRVARIGGYVFVLATIGLAAVLYFAYASFFILKQACPLCMTVYASVIGIFIVSSMAAGPLATLPSQFGQDLSAIGRSSMATSLAVLWLAASVVLILTFPRDQQVSAEEGVTEVAAAPVPMETLAPEVIAEWETWLGMQPRTAEAMPTGGVKVLLTKFNDYQCPACRQTWSLYKDIIAKYEAAYPGVFKFESRDFPLEMECGIYNAGHGAACEAAAAVRMAREKNRDKEVEAALFAQQSPSMTRDDVKETLERVAQISGSEFDTKYPTVVPAIRADAQLGQKLGIQGTPTFYINGIQFSSVRPALFEATIVWALRNAGVSS
jgi:uncharacterized membrane protein